MPHRDLCRNWFISFHDKHSSHNIPLQMFFVPFLKRAFLDLVTQGSMWDNPRGGRKSKGWFETPLKHHLRETLAKNKEVLVHRASNQISHCFAWGEESIPCCCFNQAVFPPSFAPEGSEHCPQACSMH
eukprot:EG_transcript_39920